ncbi:MAG: hypothetical protein IT513_09695 [Burkholderiales bacterium]|nr:hypothetical protein [Burkholderiales bacterium]
MRLLFRFIVAAALGAASLLSWAQTYPSKPVRIVIPYAAGGGVDAAARLVAQHLAGALGQGFVVVARPGGATVIGAESVARSPADGYTLLLTGGSTMSLLPLVHPAKLPFDPLADFVPIGMVSRLPFFLATPSKLSYNSVRDIMADARANPDRLAFGSNGVGSMAHVGIEMLLHSAGVKMIHIPYPGFAPMISDLVTGRIVMTMGDLAPLKGQIDAGAVKVLAVSSGTRSRFLPDAPTLAEAGYPGNEFEIWLALFAPAGAPQPIVDTIGRSMRAYLGSPEAREAYAKLGHEADTSDGPAVRQRIVAEQKAFAPAAAAASATRKQ